MTPELGIYHLADDRLQIDTEARRLLCDGAPLAVAPRGFEVLAQLAPTPDVLKNPFDVYEAVWQPSTDPTPAQIHNLFVTVKNLRNAFVKAGLGDAYNSPIRTKRRVGYALVSILSSNAWLWQPEHQQIVTPSIGDFALNASSYSMRVADRPPEPVTAAEFNLLDLLIFNEGQVLARGTIMHALDSRSGAADPNIVEVCIAGLRKRMGPDYGDPKHGLIQTVRGLGYKFATS